MLEEINPAAVVGMIVLLLEVEIVINVLHQQDQPIAKVEAGPHLHVLSGNQGPGGGEGLGASCLPVTNPRQPV